MRSQKLLLMTIISSLSLKSYAKFEAHEWGTFTSLVGSNGITQNGMYHEDEPLPSFVHPFGELRREKFTLPPRDPNRPCHSKICFGDDFFDTQVVTQKMETPVIYFYADQETKVDVNVKFPKGVITETYPGPVKTYPMKDSLQTIAAGDTTFSVNVLNRKTDEGPLVDANNIYSHARNVQSNLIESGAEKEKFIFYRGIGQFQPKISITSKLESVTFKVPADYKSPAAFLVNVDPDLRMKMYKVGPLDPGATVKFSHYMISQLKDPAGENPQFIRGEEAKGALVQALISSGLYKDEAMAMINTWENGYLKVPGLRLLYILPRSEVDEILPLTFSPAPENLVRSFVARIEIVTDSQEQKILNDIFDPQSNFQYFHLGRFAEPMLRRAREVYNAKSTASPDRKLELEKLIQLSSKDTAANGILQ